MCGWNPIDDIVDIVEDIVDIILDIVEDVISWIIPIPDIPDFGDLNQDQTAKGVLVNKISANATIPIIYGTRKVGGNVAFIETSGTDNQYLYMALVLGEGEIDDVTQIFVNDNLVTWSADIADNTQITVNSSDSNYFKAPDPDSSAESLITVEPHYGSDSQSASSLLSTLSSWTSNHRLRGLAYLAIRFKWNSDAFGSLPTVNAVVKGKKVYNPNLDSTKTGGSGTHREDTSSTWEYSDNPVYQLLDYLRNTRFGMGIANSYFDSNFAEWQTAGDVCDADITPYSGASAIDLMDSNIVVDTSRKAIDNVKEFLKGCRGILNYTAGAYKVLVETTGSAAITLTEDNIIGGIQISSKNKNSRYNRVIVSFINPDKNYQSDEVQFPPVDETGLASADQHATMLSADGGILLEGRFDFSMLTNPYQAQEMAEIILRRSRSSLDVSITADGTATDLQIGDIVNITHATPGFSAKPFRVQAMSINANSTVQLTLSEHQDSYYTFGTQQEVATIPDTTLPNPFSILPPASVTLDDDLVEYNDGTVITRLKITVGASTDNFVDNYEVQVKQTLDKDDNAVVDDFREIATGKILEYQLLNAIDGATYQVRVRAVNSLGVKSTYVSGTRKIIGATEPPENITAFGLSMVGSDQMQLSWTPVTDLDVEFYEIRYQKLGSGASWFNSTDLVQVPRRKSNSVLVNSIEPPFALGIKAVDKLGNESLEPAFIYSNTFGLNNFSNVSNINEHPDFNGTKTNVFKRQIDGSPCITLDTITLFDSTTGLFDSIDSNFVFETGGVNKNIISSGIYDFENTLTLPDVYDMTFSVEIDMVADDPYDLFDSGRTAELFDFAKAPFDGNLPTNAGTVIQIGASNTSLNDISTFTGIAQQGTFTGRYFKFKSVLLSNNNQARALVKELKVKINIEKRNETGDDVVSGAGSKSITFTNGFYNTPNITITAQDMATGDYFLINNKTKNGFDIIFKNSSDTAISRTFDYNAQGFGLKSA